MTNRVDAAINFTVALLASRQVAKILSGGLGVLSARCFTRPKPRPRLQPVIRIDLIALLNHRRVVAAEKLHELGKAPRAASSAHSRRGSIMTDVTCRNRATVNRVSPIIMATLTMFTRLVSLRGAQTRLLGLPCNHPSLVKYDGYFYGGIAMACMCSE